MTKPATKRRKRGAKKLKPAALPATDPRTVYQPRYTFDDFDAELGWTKPKGG